MKIGILTFWESKNNYGQILQLFAMQSALKRLGHSPFAIKFHRLSKSQLRKPGIKGLLKQFYHDLTGAKSKKRLKLSAEAIDENREFRHFKNQNIQF